MKKILVTGAAGTIGINVIRYLLSEGKYEITALDLKNRRAYKYLKKYQRRINIIYGDVNDEVLMSSLVKDHDYIIHLAGMLPPFGDFFNSVGEVEYKGCENIVKAINKLNKKCYLIYASTTSMYDASLMADTSEVIKENSLTNYSYYKYKSENLIKQNLNNYLILRVPLVLSDLKKEPFIYNVKKNSVVEITTSFDAAYAFVRAIIYSNKLNKGTYNIGLGEKGRLTYNEILNNILSNYGISFKYILARIFLDKDYISPILTDSDELNNIINYRSDSLPKYYKRLKNSGKNRKFSLLISKIILFFKKG